MDKKTFASKLENRVFDMDVHDTDVSNACYEAMYHGFASVQVFPVMIEECAKILKGSKVKIAALIDYPHGGFPPEIKKMEILDAKKRGAEIFNVCFTNRNVKDRKWEQVGRDLQILREAAGESELRIFLETEYLTDEEITKLCGYAIEAGVDTVITSTGLYYKLDKESRTEVPLLADARDIRLIKSVVGSGMKIMAQGFIDHWDLAGEVLEAGADMIGSVKAVRLLEEFH